MGDGPPAPEEIGRIDGGVRLLAGVTEGVVGLDDERGQQGIAAGEVAIDRRRRHAEVARHRPQRQPRGTVLGELVAGTAGDLGDELGPGPGPHADDGTGRGVGVGHGAIMDHLESIGNKQERCS